jgi:preprotein translocase SecE subunit
MSIEATAAGSNEPRRDKSTTRGSLFSIYKPKEGYWTRLGTAIGASAIILFFAWFVYQQSAIIPGLNSHRYYRFIAAALVVAALAALTQWIMNGPKRAQFLIDTDSEMKKVNWASWPELVGATRVVIFFMLLTALTLFIFDTQFHAFFYSLTVWHISFPAAAGLITGFVLGAVLLAIGVGLLRSRDDAKAKRSGTIVTAAGAAIVIAWLVYLIRH